MQSTLSRRAVRAASSVSDEERHARRELAACYRLADRMGWSDLISAHISHRVPGEPDHYLINPYGMLFDEISASSLIKTDAQGTILSETDYSVNPAVLVIHAAILEARPDLACVMHLHTRDGNAVATQKCGLLPATQHALVIYDQVTYHDFEGPALDPDE
ncbi:MAG: class II aldolase/adducin family protein, partial [Aquabacterium sp.]|nr:class II aldolase/adducin family protein [Aquabacterium sp.]